MDLRLFYFHVTIFSSKCKVKQFIFKNLYFFSKRNSIILPKSFRQKSTLFTALFERLFEKSVKSLRSLKSTIKLLEEIIKFNKRNLKEWKFKTCVFIVTFEEIFRILEELILIAVYEQAFFCRFSKEKWKYRPAFFIFFNFCE